MGFLSNVVINLDGELEEEYAEAEKFAEALDHYVTGGAFWLDKLIPYQVQPFYIVVDDDSVGLDPRPDIIMEMGYSRNDFIDYWLDYYIDHTSEELREYTASEFLRTFEKALDFVDYALLRYGTENGLPCDFVDVDPSTMIYLFENKHGDDLADEWGFFMKYRERWGI